MKCDVVRLSSLQGSIDFEGKQNSQIHLLKASTLVRAELLLLRVLLQLLSHKSEFYKHFTTMEMTERTQKSVKRQRRIRQDEVEIKRKRVRKVEDQESRSTKSKSQIPLAESKRSKAKKVPQNARLKSDQKSRKSDETSSQNSKRTTRSSTRPLNSRATSRTTISSYSKPRQKTNDTLIDMKNHQKKNEQVQCEPKTLIRVLVVSSAVGFLVTVIFLIYIWLS